MPALAPVDRRAASRRGVIAMIALAAFVLVLQLQIVGYAFHLAGLSALWVGVVLAASVVGSLVDVPVMHLRAADSDVVYVPVRVCRAVVHLIPVERPPITLAVNVGGAVVPTAVSVYILAHTGRWLAAAGTVLAVALVVHATATPVTSVGVVLPVLLPAVVAALVATLLGTGSDAAAVAYVGAGLGTLIGADLANLRWLRSMSGGVLSIGGAGTFDGIFVAGVLGVFLASVL